MTVSDDYFEALCWAQQWGAGVGDNRVGYSIIVDCSSVVAVLALPPSKAEDYCEKLSRRHGRALQLLDQHFGTWEGEPGELTEKQVKEEIKAFNRRIQPRTMTRQQMQDAEHAEGLAILAEVSCFKWTGLDSELLKLSKQQEQA